MRVTVFFKYFKYISIYTHTHIYSIYIVYTHILDDASQKNTNLLPVKT